MKKGWNEKQPDMEVQNKFESGEGAFSVTHPPHCPLLSKHTGKSQYTAFSASLSALFGSNKSPIQVQVTWADTKHPSSTVSVRTQWFQHCFWISPVQTFPCLLQSSPVESCQLPPTPGNSGRSFIHFLVCYILDSYYVIQCFPTFSDVFPIVSFFLDPYVILFLQPRLCSISPESLVQSFLVVCHTFTFVTCDLFDFLSELCSDPYVSFPMFSLRPRSTVSACFRSGLLN